MTAPAYVLDADDLALDADLILIKVTELIAERHGWHCDTSDAYQADIETFMSAIAACDGDRAAEFLVGAANLILLNHERKTP